MDWLHWLGENWFSALQSFTIASGFVFTAVTLRREERSRRVSSLFQLTTSHRELWSLVFTHPELRRVSSLHPDLTRHPVTDDESLFVGFLILHLRTAHLAITLKLMPAPEGLGTDIGSFFSYPIPRAVWEAKRQLQDEKFVAFVEGHFRAS